MLLRQSYQEIINKMFLCTNLQDHVLFNREVSLKAIHQMYYEENVFWETLWVSHCWQMTYKSPLKSSGNGFDLCGVLGGHDALGKEAQLKELL